MSQPTRILPTRAMARVLAEHRPADRATPEAAALVLFESRLFGKADIVAGLEAAMRLAGDAAAGALDAAASDAPWAQGLGYLRDLAAFCVITFGGAWAWAILA